MFDHRNRFVIWYVPLLVIAMLLYSCDDSDSVKPRFDSFFIKYYGGSGDQFGNSFIRTPDGGYVIVGTSDPDRSIVNDGNPGDEDIFIVKTDSLGNEDWSQTYDPSGSQDFGKDIIQTANGYLVIGDTQINGLDGVYFEIDMQGQIIGNYIPVDEGGNETFNSITKIQGGYVIAGSTDNARQEPGPGVDAQDLLTIKIFDDLTEDPAWEQNKINGRDGRDSGVKSFENPADPTRLITFGYTDEPEGNSTIWDNDTFYGLEFDNTTTGIDHYYGDLQDQICEDVVERLDGMLMIGTKVLQGQNEIYFVRTTGVAETQVASSIFLELGSSMRGKSIFPSIDNRVIHLGEIIYPRGDSDIFLGKTDINGNTIWSETFGDSGNDLAAKVLQNSDGTIVFTGTMNLSGQNKIFLIKTNPDGQLKR